MFTDRGARPVGVYIGKEFRVIPEMVPELIVPNLDGFKVSWMLFPLINLVFSVVQFEFRKISSNRHINIMH